MHMEKCQHQKCGKPHDTKRGQAVRIDGKYYCKPSCANAARGAPGYTPPVASKRTP